MRQIVHRPMKTCDGLDCRPECPFRARVGDPRWAAYLAPRGTGQVTRCRHLGAPTGETVECPSCTGTVRLKTFGCGVHGVCTTARAVAGTACCQGCRDYVAEESAVNDPDAIYVELLPECSGIGDHAVVSLAAEGLRLANPGKRIVLVTPSSHAAAWMRLWWADVLVGPAPAGSKPLQPLHGRPLGRRAVPRWAHAARRAGVEPVMPTLWAPLPPEHVQAVQHFAGHVVLAPEATSDDRVWPLPCWLELERLLIEAGYRCVVLGQQASHLLRFRSTPFVSQEPARVAALLQAAGCLVGNDGGPCHLAGLLSTPAVALCGSVDGRRVFGAYPSVRWIDGPMACTGCEWSDPEPRMYGCGNRCASLGAIPPYVVVDVVRQVVRSPQKPAPVGPVAVVTCWDDAYEPLARVTWPALVQYCARRGYTPVRGAIDANRHPTWSKIPAILAALDQHQAVLWTDADALITGDADPLELLGDADVAAAHDPNGFNAGVLVLRATPLIKAALASAWDAYERFRAHIWADQLAIAEALASHGVRVRVLPQRELNVYPGQWQPGDFVLHTPAMPIEARLAAFRAAGDGGRASK